MSAYQDFIKSGHDDAEWEAYQANANNIRRTDGRIGIIAKWTSGEPVSGASIYRLMVDSCIAVETALSSLLQDDATTLTQTSIECRGLTRKQAKHWLAIVNERMAYIVYPE